MSVSCNRDEAAPVRSRLFTSGAEARGELRALRMESAQRKRATFVALLRYGMLRLGMYLRRVAAVVGAALFRGAGGLIHSLLQGLLALFFGAVGEEPDQEGGERHG